MRNRMAKEKSPGIVLAIALAVLLLFTACAPGPPAEKEKVVRIGMIAPLTGAPAAVVQYGWRNIVDYIRYFEEEGILR